MTMTKKRKSLQDKLRRTFKWSTNTNYGRGTILEKEDVSTTQLYHDPKHVIDLAVYIDDYQLRQMILGKPNHHEIELTLKKYDVLGEDDYKKVSELFGYITFEELELIYTITKEKIHEACIRISETN